MSHTSLVPNAIIAAAASTLAVFFALAPVHGEQMQVLGASPAPDNSTPEVAVSQRLVLHDVMLSATSFEIDPAARPVLDYAARLLRENPSTLVYVSGQGDRDMVRRQAQAVMNYLERHGVPANRLIVQEASAAQTVQPDESDKGVIVLNLSGPGCATCPS